MKKWEKDEEITTRGPGTNEAAVSERAGCVGEASNKRVRTFGRKESITWNTNGTERKNE
jgi:hypothetical protein